MVIIAGWELRANWFEPQQRFEIIFIKAQRVYLYRYSQT